MSDETKNKPALEDNFAELEDILKQMEQPEISLAHVRYRREKDADFKCQRGTGRFLRCRRCIWRSRYGYQSGNRQTYR